MTLFCSQSIIYDTLKPKNFGGKTWAEIFSVAFCKFRQKIFQGRFYNVARKNFELKKYDRFGKMAVFKG